MKSQGSARLLRLFLLGALLVPAALADVDMKLTGAGSNVLGGVYIGPYTATINGVPTKVICDDFTADTYLNETWTAAVHSFDNLTGAKFYTGPDLAAKAQSYFQVAWLSNQLLDPNVVCAPGGSQNCRGEIQYAIWEVFAPGTIAARLGGANNAVAKAAANWWLGQAAGKTYTADQFADLRILTPKPGSAKGCPGGTCADPQELIVRVPEASAFAMLAVNLFGLYGLITALRRRGWKLTI